MVKYGQINDGSTQNDSPRTSIGPLGFQAGLRFRPRVSAGDAMLFVVRQREEGCEQESTYHGGIIYRCSKV